jgi:uncharacterized membrane protein YccC
VTPTPGETPKPKPSPFEHLKQWLTTRDRGLLALRRAARTAIVMPLMFAFGDKVLGNASLATFAAFGSFAMLMLVDFGGPMRDRLKAQATLSVVGVVLVCLGTLASRDAWLAAAAMGVVGFGVLFVGVVSSVLAGATTSLLLAFILPVSLPGTPSDVPDRLAGWAMAGAAAVVAISLLWPAPANDPLRGQAAATCRALAARMRSDVEHLRAGRDGEKSPERQRIALAAESSVAELHRLFLATPYRPTGLSTSARAVVRLVDQLSWLNAIMDQSRPARPTSPHPAACEVKIAAAGVLEHSADLLVAPRQSTEALDSALAALRDALTRLEDDAVGGLPTGQAGQAGQSDPDVDPPTDASPDGPDGNTPAPPDEVLDDHVSAVIDALDPSFRAQEMGFVVAAIGDYVDVAAGAEHRTWPERLLGRQPAGVAGTLPGTLAAAQERAFTHVERHSVWLHNSVRGAIGLAAAVLVANLIDVQHSFWVVLGTLSVLRSNALNTGQNALRAVLGTTAGFALGALLLLPIGHETALLWALLPVAIMVAGVAPAVISFAAGQAGFTLVLVILYNIIQPTGWRVGLVRVEDVAIGCAVSLAVGVLFWPRGAAAALNKAMAKAYTDSARYLAAAVEFGMTRCDACDPPTPAPAQQAALAAAASRRIDDAFRQYLAERGAKTIPLAEIARVIGGAMGLRLAADAVLDLWERNGDETSGDRTAARLEVLAHMEQVTDWYYDFAEGLEGKHPLPTSIDRDEEADARLVRAVQRDLQDRDGKATATAVRMIWTGDHLDAMRRLQPTLAQPARTALGLPSGGFRAGYLVRLGRGGGPGRGR